MEQRLSFDITRATGEVQLKAQLPGDLASNFVGQDIADVVQKIPLLFSVCGAAQGYVATQTAETILRADAAFDRQRASARALLVLAEKGREYVLRLLMEAATLCGDKSGLSRFAATQDWRARLSEAGFGEGNPFDLFVSVDLDQGRLNDLINEIEGYLVQTVFDRLLMDWQNISAVATLQNWTQTSASGAARLLTHLWALEKGAPDDNQIVALGALSGALMFERVNKASFRASPLIDGQAVETGALARQKDHPLIKALFAHYGRGVLVRYVARLIELAMLPQQMRALLDGQGRTHEGLCQTTCMGEGQAISSLETARGRLYHVITLAGQKVCDYKILSPTHWNFHASSIAVEKLKEITAQNADEMKEKAGILIRAIDPCVQYDVRVH
ncbi:hypothetical protein [Terasakiella pusilla]|uniref:hypothetical protein n=1 Tax=Terasakiella pusilla TaxID=64973 RepID=UPI003AA8750A